MEIIKGIAVSPGVAICPAVVLDAEDYHVPRRLVPHSDVPHQHARLDEAIGRSRIDIEQLREQVENDLGHETALIFSFHLGLLKDDALIGQIHDHIAEEAVTAEYALAKVLRDFAKLMTNHQNAVFRERASDIWDIEKRVLRHLIEDSVADIDDLHHEAVIVAHDLTPSQTASLDKSTIKGIVTDVGGRTSHTAIVARALRIPAVVGAESATKNISSSDTVVVDGHRGLVIINPDPEQLEEYKDYVQQIQARAVDLADIATQPAITKDGIKISLNANVEFNSEIQDILENGADGIGLYRTEYLFLSNESEPDEEEQFNTLADAIKQVDGKIVTIRTLDLGADKFTQRHAELKERNPFLGCRSIRFCLQNLSLFKTHLRAILRASAFGPIRIMFPLISNMLELRQTRMILHDVMEDLEDQNIPFDRNVQIGIMIEVPSTAIMARTFVTEVDFFSIGTNDLVQYTLAVDRANEHVANLYSPANPAVLRLIKDVIRAGKRGAVDVSICGEMAGEPQYAMPLLGLGLRSLSMSPPAIPAIKQIIRAVTIADCERVARRIAAYDSERQVVNYLREETRKVLPEVYDGRTVV